MRTNIAALMSTQTVKYSADNKFKDFELFYSKLIAWIKDKEGALPAEVNKEDPQLGRMVANARTYYKVGKLMEEQVNRLNAVKEWYFSQNDLLNKNCDKLIEFMKNNNNKMPSQKGVSDEEKKLGRLRKCIGEKYNNNELSEEIKTKLDATEGWSWTENVFEKNLEKLKEYVRNNNKLPKRTSHNDTDTNKLALWCSLMKSEQKEGKLCEHKVNKLNAVNLWEWFGDDFDEYYIKVTDWVKNHNELPRENNKDAYEKQLAYWVKNIKQKMSRNSSNLTPEKIAQLNRINIFPMGTKN
jgi:hypothetical protein